MYLEALVFWGGAALIVTGIIGGIASFIEEVNKIRI